MLIGHLCIFFGEMSFQILCPFFKSGFFSPFLKIFYWLWYYSCPISPFIPLHPAHPLPPSFPYLSSCPWVIHISSLASPFPILFLTSPCLFVTYWCVLLNPCTFSPIFPDAPPQLATIPMFSVSIILLLLCLFP